MATIPEMYTNNQQCPPPPPPFYRRHMPFMSQPDFRMFELNKRLQHRNEDSDNLWWDAFATEFFEDDATLTLSFCLEDGPKRYTIGRTLIPRYFRSIFEGGVTDAYYVLKHSKESFHNTSITLDCEQTTMVTYHAKPMSTKICTEGRLILEFTFDDLMRIRSWHFQIRNHSEMIARNVISVQDPAMLEQLSKNVTRQGLTHFTLNYLRLCVILEPMQELMSRHKAYNLSPRDCLKATLFQKWQRMVAPPDIKPPVKENSFKKEPTRSTKKRRRKMSTTTTTSNATGFTGSVTGSSKKKSPAGYTMTASEPIPTDVMVVGEPSLMGGDFGDEDERLISRLENTQFDVSNGMDTEEDFENGANTNSSNQSPWNPGERSTPAPPSNQTQEEKVSTNAT
ncbi:LIM domain-binding protein 2-like isoform X1 [Antedon mediterranea]|uniref:LIM domain-binding protein 2-like isoform X1 n=1 Tax=Antedon mediterranea TaxID=105859 RepID=UPI003AF7DF14